mmetsp:Transcript_15146/g.30234  ORF Transcript_15146/g.30234 Transcript_15146/m.30234 type:complete len:270 (+) Transcript_15146:430-1239(+)
MARQPSYPRPRAAPGRSGRARPPVHRSEQGGDAPLRLFFGAVPARRAQRRLGAAAGLLLDRGGAGAGALRRVRPVLHRPPLVPAHTLRLSVDPPAPPPPAVAEPRQRGRGERAPPRVLPGGVQPPLRDLPGVRGRRRADPRPRGPPLHGARGRRGRHQPHALRFRRPRVRVDPLRFQEPRRPPPGAAEQLRTVHHALGLPALPQLQAVRGDHRPEGRDGVAAGSGHGKIAAARTGRGQGRQAHRMTGGGGDGRVDPRRKGQRDGSEEEK